MFSSWQFLSHSLTLYFVCFQKDPYKNFSVDMAVRLLFFSVFISCEYTIPIRQSHPISSCPPA